MMTDYDFDLLLESTMASRGPQVAPALLGDVVMDGVRGASQRRPWIRGLDRRAWPAPRHSIADPATIRAGRIILVAVLTMALIAASAAVGSWLQETDHRPRLVFGSAAGGLYVADHDGSNARQIADEGQYVEPRFSPDGRWIAADLIPSTSHLPVRGSTIDRRLVILRADGARVVDLPSMNPPWAYAWGASGGAEGWLAASLDESIVVVDPVTGSMITIDLAGQSVQALAWSPDAPVLWWAVGRADGFREITEAWVYALGIHQVDGALQKVGERTFPVRLDPARSIRALERMAISPNGRTLAFRARLEGWMRSDVAIVDGGGGVPASWLNPAVPGEPLIGAFSGIRWTPDGGGVVVEVGEMVGTDAAVIRPAILPLDGSAPHFIEAGPFTVEAWGGVVADDGPVLWTDTTILVGGTRDWVDVAGGQVAAYDLWVADATGEGSRLVASDTFGGDLR